MVKKAQPILQVTPASEWRKPREEGVLFPFPSGRVAKVRPVGMDTFLETNEVKDVLTPIVVQLVNGQASLETMQVSHYQSAMAMINGFVKSAFIEPRIVDDVQDPDQEILITDVEQADKDLLFSFLGSPASALVSFREQQEKLMAGVVGGEGDGTNP